MHDVHPPARIVAVAVLLTLTAVGLLLSVGAASAPIAAALPRTPLDIGPLAPSTAYTICLPLVSRSLPLTPDQWYGDYYANTTFDGDPVYTIEERRLDFDWGNGAPSDLPADDFAVRWTGWWRFEAGEYTFFLDHDDGVRLWLDDDLLIDRWEKGIASHQATVSFAEEGLHLLVLEYFEATGQAYVRLRWRRTDLYPQWQGEYYIEPWVENGHVGSQTSSAIQFDWGDGCPTLVQPHCDSFSISWTARPLFEAGTHRLFLYADEGYQLYVDGHKVQEGGWYDGQEGGSEDAVYVLEVGGIEQHTITYNFHDRGGPAEARFWPVYMEHPTWLVEFFANIELNGSPQITDPDGYKIFFDWGLGKPREAMPSADNFSVRWTGQRYFHAGCYRFGLFADDGVRLWVDGDLLVDQWHDGRAEYHSPVTCLSTGYHPVIVEYYDHTGEAEIRFWWE